MTTYRLNIDSALAVLAAQPERPPALDQLLALRSAQERHENVGMRALDFLDYLLILGYRFETEHLIQNGVTYLCCKLSST